MTTTDADKLAYSACMEQVKRRLRLVRRLLGQEWSTGEESADVEFLCLQVRKMLEQIAFSALAASRERYSEVYREFEMEWRAKRILERLTKLHPDFYPVPLLQVPRGPNRWHFDLRADGFLTQADFVFLYEKCSKGIHDWNPFNSDPRVINFERPLPEWIDRIEGLLACHKIRLIDQTDVLVIQLHGTDGKAHVFTGSPQAG